MIIVSDTSPITNLIQIKKLKLLKELFGEIIIPKAVYTDLSIIENQKIIIDKNAWIKIKNSLKN